jgi:hypothetical protein
MTDRLQDLPDTLTAFSRGHIGVDELARAWREAAYAHEPALPERYVTVLERVLNQLESAALFTEESCSFSQADMAAALGDWLAKARALSNSPLA